MSATTLVGSEIAVTRTFNAPRELVFDAFTKPEHMKHWFGPREFTTPVVEADLRAGGKSRVCMRSSDGKEFWSSGTYHEVVRPERYVLTSALDGEGDVPLFEVLQEVTFEDLGGQTRVTVNNKVLSLNDPSMVGAISGMEEGWNQTLDKLAEYLPTLGGKA